MLLVVIPIISLLSSIFLSSLEIERRKTRNVVRKNDLCNIQNALELYAVTHGSYPDNLDKIIDPDYLFNLPLDPKITSPYSYNASSRGFNCFFIGQT